MIVELNFITSQIIIANESLTRLVHVECSWKFLSTQVNRERVPAIIREMYLSDLNCVIS